MSSPLSRPRILIVTRNLPPLVGGMERLNWHMAEELTKVADVRIVGPAGSAALAPTGVQVSEAPLKPLWKFLLRARALARREARAWCPDIVLAGSGLTAPIARAAASACRARTAVYVHGLDVAVKHPVYRALWLPAIRHADHVIANSHATAGLCRDIGVDPARIGIVHPGVDLPSESVPSPLVIPGLRHAQNPESRSPAMPGRNEGAALEPLSPRERGRGEGPHTRNVTSPRSPTAGRTPPATLPADDPRNGPVASRHDFGNRAVLLSVGRLSARKGLREFVTQALPQIVAAHPDTLLLVVGDAPNQALHAEAQTPASIQAAADVAGIGGNIRFLGVITDYAELGTIYRAADVHVFPIRAIPDDPEGFGMVAVEAAAHGLPTVAFATGGVVDAVAEGQSGYLVAPGDYPAFAAAVLATFGERDKLRDGCVTFARQFVWSEFGSRLVAQLSLPSMAQQAAMP